MTSNNSAFSEWYHYLFLAVWLVILMIGLKYYPEIDKKFHLKNGSSGKSTLAIGFLLSSFILGFVMFLLQTFFTDNKSVTAVTYVTYGMVVFLLFTNAYVCFKYYVAPGLIIRMILLSILIILYFYSGLLGGLLLIAIFSFVVIVYLFIKFKNILTIK